MGEFFSLNKRQSPRKRRFWKETAKKAQLGGCEGQYREQQRFFERKNEGKCREKRPFFVKEENQTKGREKRRFS